MKNKIIKNGIFAVMFISSGYGMEAKDFLLEPPGLEKLGLEKSCCEGVSFELKVVRIPRNEVPSVQKGLKRSPRLQESDILRGGVSNPPLKKPPIENFPVPLTRSPTGRELQRYCRSLSIAASNPDQSKSTSESGEDSIDGDIDDGTYYLEMLKNHKLDGSQLP